MALEAMVLRGAEPAPVPTTPPHPRDVALKLERRQGLGETCGWIGAAEASSLTCAAGSVCAHNTLYDAAFCCNSILFPYCGSFPTTCLDSTSVRSGCTGFCLFNPAVMKCTMPGSRYCVTVVLSQSTLNSPVTAYDCSPSPGKLTAYGYYTSNSKTITSGIAQRSDAIGTLVTSSDRIQDPISTSSSIPVSTSTKKGGLSGGAIAGIAIAGILVLAGLLIALGMFFVYRYKTNRRRKNEAAFQPPQQPPTAMPSPMGEPSRPQYTSMHSGTPLTHAAMSEITPNESASQIGGYTSNVTHNPPQEQLSASGGTSTNTPSGVGPLPQFHNQNQNIYGAQEAQSVAGTDTVMNPGSAFGSMPPVRAPDVPSSGHWGAAEMRG